MVMAFCTSHVITALKSIACDATPRTVLAIVVQFPCHEFLVDFPALGPLVSNLTAKPADFCATFTEYLPSSLFNIAVAFWIGAPFHFWIHIHVYIEFKA